MTKNNKSGFCIYTICLEREEARRKLLEANFSGLNVHSRFIGIDGRMLPEKYREKYSDNRAVEFWGRSLTQGEVGCYASHMAVWEQVLAGEEEFALIMESDALLTSEALDIVDLIVSKHSDVDMVMLSWADCVPSFYGVRKLTRGYRLVKFARKSYYASAYLISRKGARELLKHSQCISLPVDELMLGQRVMKDMNIYAVYPRLVKLIEQYYDTSTLNKERESLTSVKDQGEKRKKVGLRRFEQWMRHLLLRIRQPPKV